MICPVCGRRVEGRYIDDDICTDASHGRPVGWGRSGNSFGEVRVPAPPGASRTYRQEAGSGPASPAQRPRVEGQMEDSQ